MPYVVLEFKANGRIVKTIQPKAPSYDQLVKAVDGIIQKIPEFNKAMHQAILYKRGAAYANEEGRLKGLPINRNAMALWRFSCPNGDESRMVLCGDIIFYAKVT